MKKKCVNPKIFGDHVIHFSKYIVVAIYGGHCERMVIFHKDIKHKTMANLMKQAGYRTLVSAGLIDEFMQCYGDSNAWIPSRGEKDTIILHKTMGIHDKELKFNDGCYFCKDRFTFDRYKFCTRCGTKLKIKD